MVQQITDLFPAAAQDIHHLLQLPATEAVQAIVLVPAATVQPTVQVRTEAVQAAAAVQTTVLHPATEAALHHAQFPVQETTALHTGVLLQVLQARRVHPGAAAHTIVQDLHHLLHTAEVRADLHIQAALQEALQAEVLLAAVLLQEDRQRFLNLL